MSSAMTCPFQTQETELLLDYSAGRLDAARTAVLARHMETCPACASFRMAQTAVWNALDVWEPAPVSMDFNRRLWQRIEAAAAAPWYRSLLDSLRLTNWKPLIPLTAAVLVITGGFLLDHPAVQRPEPGVSVIGVSVKEADQVEQTLDDIQLLQQLDAVTPPNSGTSKSM
jgi:anti-sigma factor RsiW